MPLTTVKQGGIDYSTLMSLVNGQIAFPAAQNASAGVNTLDDYEEGSFSPVIGGATSESGQTYSVQVGRYVKVGKLVQASGYVVLSAKGTITGGLYLKGLPFVVGTITNYYPAGQIGYFSGFSTNWMSLFMQCNAAFASAAIMGVQAAGTTIATGPVTADITNAFAFEFALSYITDN